MQTSENSQIKLQEALLNVVSNPDIDPDRLEKFLDLQIKMEERGAKRQFNEALAMFQGECPIIKKNSSVDFTAKSGGRTKYNYASLDEIVYQIKPILSKYGLSFSFNVRNTGNPELNELLTKIYHVSGHSETFSHFYKPLHNDTRMNDSQRIKSALTFAKRAGLESALGIVNAEEDQDAARLIDTPASESTIEQIKELMERTGSDEAKLLKFLKVEKLEDLSQFEAKKAIHSLKQKRAK